MGWQGTLAPLRAADMHGAQTQWTRMSSCANLMNWIALAAQALTDCLGVGSADGSGERRRGLHRLTLHDRHFPMVPMFRARDAAARVPTQLTSTVTRSLTHSISSAGQSFDTPGSSQCPFTFAGGIP